MLLVAVCCCQLSKAAFWSNTAFYGVDLSSVLERANDEYFSQAVVGTFPLSALLSTHRTVHTIDFSAVTPEVRARARPPAHDTHAHANETPNKGQGPSLNKRARRSHRTAGCPTLPQELHNFDVDFSFRIDRTALMHGACGFVLSCSVITLFPLSFSPLTVHGDPPWHAMPGIAGWFDLSFVGSTEHVVLSTAPECPATHWYQVHPTPCPAVRPVQSHRSLPPVPVPVPPAIFRAPRREPRAVRVRHPVLRRQRQGTDCWPAALTNAKRAFLTSWRLFYGQFSYTIQMTARIDGAGVETTNVVYLHDQVDRDDGPC